MKVDRFVVSVFRVHCDIPDIEGRQKVGVFYCLREAFCTRYPKKRGIGGIQGERCNYPVQIISQVNPHKWPGEVFFNKFDGFVTDSWLPFKEFLKVAVFGSDREWRRSGGECQNRECTWGVSENSRRYNMFDRFQKLTYPSKLGGPQCVPDRIHRRLGRDIRSQ